LILRIGFVLHPIAGVVEQRVEALMDVAVIDADILVRCAIGSRPAPDLAEHAPVEVAPEGLVERPPQALKRPQLRLDDIRLLQFVELMTQGDMSWNQAVSLFRAERGRVAFLLEEIR